MIKTLEDIKDKIRPIPSINLLCTRDDFLRDAIKEWIKEIDEITDNYVENGGNLSDDEVIAIIKEKHPEWIAFMGDWSDDDLSRLYFLTDWMRYFFNLEEEQKNE